MINRELTSREIEILNMIRPTSFYDIVDVVRREIDQSAYNARRELRNLRNLHNGILMQNECITESLENLNVMDCNDIPISI